MNVQHFSMRMLLVFCFLPTADLCFANPQTDDREEILANIAATAEARATFQDGLSFSITRTNFMDGKQVSQSVSKFSRKSSDTWKDELKVGDNSLVRGANKDITYDANDTSGEFEYQKASPEPTRAMKIAMIGGQNDTFGLPLIEWISQSSVSFTPLGELPPQNGRRVEGIKFKEYEVEGEIHWLPDHNYLLTRVYAVAIFPDEEIGVRDNRMEYGLWNDRLVLTKKITGSGDSYSESAISDFAEANTGKEFYKPEALGLETPVATQSRWYLWAIVSVVALLAAGWFFFKHRKSR